MKYKLTGETKEFAGVTFCQIESVRDFGNIKIGDIGGWVENSKNLSHDGDCWIDDESIVIGLSVVSGNSLVFKSYVSNSVVYDSDVSNSSVYKSNVHKSGVYDSDVCNSHVRKSIVYKSRMYNSELSESVMLAEK